MLKAFRQWLGRLRPAPPGPTLTARIQRAIEHIEPRLKFFSSYPRAYQHSIQLACQHSAALGTSLPPVLTLSPEAFAQEPLVHALFNNTEAMHNMIGDSRDIRDYCRQYGRPPEGHLYALMGVRRREKEVIGTVLNGDNLQHEEQHTLVYFESHTLSLPCTSEKELTELIEQHLFDSLINSLQDHITGINAERQQLQTERDSLVARLRAQQAPLNAEQKLQHLRERLAELDAHYDLNHYHKLFDEFMAQAPQHLRLELNEIPIDMRGVKRNSDDRLAGRFTFHELVGRDRRRWTLIPVCLPVAKFQDAMQCGSGTERWMEI